MEELKRKSIRPCYVEVDELQNGIVRRVVKMDLKDHSKPITPQSGVETHIGDLPYMVKNQLKIQHEPAYLSNLKRNPLEESRFVAGLTQSYDSFISKHFEQLETE